MNTGQIAALPSDPVKPSDPIKGGFFYLGSPGSEFLAVGRPRGGRSPLLKEIASDAVLQSAFQWLCERRKGYSPNNDVWALRERWAELRPRIQHSLRTGEYRLDVLALIPHSADHLALWSARDALVLKAISIVLTRHLAPRLPRTCTHLINNGGAKAAVRRVAGHLPGHQFVFRSDVWRYYASIDHEILYAQLQRLVPDRAVLGLLWQYLRHTVCDRGLYREVTRGIAFGCPLSPLMGAIYLQPLDERMARADLPYVRFMDDWVVLAPTRWQLRRAVKAVNEVLAALKLKQHPDKTFVGRIRRGFDFLGYRFSPAGIVDVARASVQQRGERIGQLYEQGADAVRIGAYVTRWWTWVRSGTGPYLWPAFARVVSQRSARRRLPSSARAVANKPSVGGSGTGVATPA